LTTSHLDVPTAVVQRSKDPETEAVVHPEAAATTAAKKATCPATALNLAKSAEEEAVASVVIVVVAHQEAAATTAAKKATCPATALNLVKSAEEEAVAMAATVVEATEVIAAMVEVENQDIKDLNDEKHIKTLAKY
jgi:hypothetical protein